MTGRGRGLRQFRPAEESEDQGLGLPPPPIYQQGQIQIPTSLYPEVPAETEEHVEASRGRGRLIAPDEPTATDEHVGLQVGASRGRGRLTDRYAGQEEVGLGLPPPPVQTGLGGIGRGLRRMVVTSLDELPLLPPPNVVTSSVIDPIGTEGVGVRLASQNGSGAEGVEGSSGAQQAASDITPSASEAERKDSLSGTTRGGKVSGEEFAAPGHHQPSRAHVPPAPSVGVQQIQEVAGDAAVPAVVAPVPRKRVTTGQPVNCIANFLILKVKENMGVFEYHVAFEPDIDSTSTRRKVVATLPDLGTRRTFDGAKLCLPTRLANNVTIISATNPADMSPVVVTVTFVKKCEPEHCIQHYNILLRRAMEYTDLREISRKFFDPVKIHRLPQHKMEIMAGYETAVEDYDSGLMACIETKHRVTQMRTVHDLMNGYKVTHRANWKDKFKEMIVGRSVLTRYNNRFYKIDDVDFTKNPESVFESAKFPDGRATFTDYYFNTYGEKITDKEQPLLMARAKQQRRNERVEPEVILLVPELTYPTGLTEDITSNFNAMKDLIEKTRIIPNARLTHIGDLIKRIQGCAEAMSLLGSWGLVLEPAPIQVEGRRLNGPTLKFNDRTERKNMQEADINRQSTAGHCFRPVELTRWLVFAHKDDNDKAKKFIESYKQVAPQLGIRVRMEPEIRVIASGGGVRQMSASDVQKYIDNHVMRSSDQVQFIVVILPQNRDDLYAAVKKQCLLLEKTVPSQVMLGKTLNNEKRLRSVMQKVVLQINCKLGGALWALQIPLKEGIMFVGIDTYHDPLKKKKSVLAMVAAIETQCTQYYSRVNFQAPHQETADAMRGMFEEMMAAYLQLNHKYPDRVVVFRDGVGDGQFKNVSEHEVPQFREAIKEVSGNLNTKFQFIIVQKRINERFFTKTQGGVENPAPGTFVDHTICRKNQQDFFLVSQFVRQGTVTPTHYTVVEDCGEAKPELYQRFAFLLCYMYFNWPGAVRAPAVCQYAHKLAYLGGQHLGQPPDPSNNTKLYYL